MSTQNAVLRLKHKFRCCTISNISTSFAREILHLTLCYTGNFKFYRTLWMWDTSLERSLLTQSGQNRTKRLGIHASSGIRTQRSKDLCNRLWRVKRVKSNWHLSQKCFYILCHIVTRSCSFLVIRFIDLYDNVLLAIFNLLHRAEFFLRS
jgi:hypothetical protein